MSVEQKISKLDALLQICRAELEEIRLLLHSPRIIQKGMKVEVPNADQAEVPENR